MENHIILSNGRSGSNYITNLLNTHPNLVNYGEVLGNWTIPYKLHNKFRIGGSSLKQFLNYIYNSNSFFYTAQLYSAFSHIKSRQKISFKLKSNICSVGIKEFALNFRRLNLLDYLNSRCDVFVINLYRENQLKRLLSLEMMNANRLVAIKSSKNNSILTSKNKLNKIYLDPEFLLSRLFIFQSEIDDQMLMTKNLPSSRVLHIRYEDLFASKTSKKYFANKVFSFLNVKPLKLESSHQKILSNRISDLVENYEEIYATLKNSDFERFLSE